MSDPNRQWVEITFDCLPLRAINRFDVPLDAPPEYERLVRNVKQAIETHGTHNSYFLCNAKCVFHLTNDPEIGLLSFRLQGTVLTGSKDLKTRQCDLQIELLAETCDWLTLPS